MATAKADAQQLNGRSVEDADGRPGARGGVEAAARGIAVGGNGDAFRLRPLAEEDGAFVPYREMSSRRRYDSVLLGEVYNTDIEEVCAAIRRAGERKEVLALSSHSITPDAKGINLKTEWLERMLATARDAGVVVEGIDYFRRPDSFK